MVILYISGFNWAALEAISNVFVAGGAIWAAIFASRAVKQEFRLLQTAQNQVRIAQEQVEATLLPVVIFKIDKDSSCFTLSNVGNGPAIEIHVHLSDDTITLNRSKSFDAIGSGESMSFNIDLLSGLLNTFNILFHSASGKYYFTEGWIKGKDYGQKPQRIIYGEELAKVKQKIEQAIQKR